MYVAVAILWISVYVFSSPCYVCMSHEQTQTGIQSQAYI